MPHLVDSPKVIELLRRFLEAIRDTDVRYAVGGAVAMAAHGVRRHTTDLDVFAPEESRGKLLRALRAAGFRVSGIFEPFHYIAMLPGEEDLDVRIDILIPAGEPELSAVEQPSLAVFEDGQFFVFPIELLVMSKFMSDPLDRPGDRGDIVRMYNRGIFEPQTVCALFASFDPDEAAQFRTWMATVTHRPQTTRRYLPRKPDGR
jgi:hypothetical protein